MADANLKIIIGAAVDDAVSALNRAKAAITGVGSASQTADAEITHVGATLEGLQGRLLIFNQSVQAAQTVLEKLRGIADVTEVWQNLEARLTSATGSQNAAREAMQGIVEIAEKTHQPLESVGELYARLAQNTKELNVPQQTLLQFTQAVSDALVVSGAKASEASGALLQLSQAIGSGVLRGQEFNSIAEQMPALLDAMARQLGTTRGALRAMAEQGKLTSDVVINAAIGMSAEWRKAAEQMPATLSRGMQDLNTAWTQFLGQSREVTAVTGLMAQGLETIARHLDDVASIAGGAALAALPAAFSVVAKSVTSWASAQREAITATNEQFVVAARERAAALDSAQAHEAVALAVRNGAAARAEDARMTLAQVEAKAQELPYLARTATYQKELAAATREAAAANTAAAAAQREYLASLGATSAAQEATAAAGGRLRQAFTALLNPMNLLQAGFAAMIGYDIGKWLGDMASHFTATAKEGSTLAAVLNAIGLGASENERIQARLADSQEKVRAKLKAISDQTGVNASSMADLNKMVERGVLVFDSATGAYQRGAVSLSTFASAATTAKAQYDTLTKTLEFGSKLTEQNAQTTAQAAQSHAQYLKSLGDETGALAANVEAGQKEVDLSKVKADNLRAELALTEQAIAKTQEEIKAKGDHADAARQELESLEKTAVSQRASIQAADLATEAAWREVQARQLAAQTYGDQSGQLNQLAAAQAAARAEVDRLSASERSAAQARAQLAPLQQAIREETERYHQALAAGETDVTGYVTNLGRMRLEEQALIGTIEAGENASKRLTGARDALSLATARYADALRDAVANAQAEESATSRRTQLVEAESQVRQGHLKVLRDEALARGDVAEAARLESEMSDESVRAADQTAQAKAAEAQAARDAADAIRAQAEADGVLTAAERESIAAAEDNARAKELEASASADAAQAASDEADAHKKTAKAAKEHAQAASGASAALADIVNTTRSSLYGFSEPLGKEFDSLYARMFNFNMSLAQWVDTWNGLIKLTWGEFTKQRDAAAALTQQLEGMNVPMASIIHNAQIAASGMRLLGDQQLDPLRQAIADAQQKLQALEDQAKSALQSTQDELDQLLGNQKAIEDRAYAEREASLKAQLDQARQAQDRAAQDELQLALKNAEEIHKIKLANIQDEAAKQSEADQQSAARNRSLAASGSGGGGAMTTQQLAHLQQPTKVVRIQLALPNGAAPSVDATESSAETFLRELQRQGMRAVPAAG